MRELAFAGALLLVVYSASPLHLPLNNPNEGVRVFVAKALVEHGTFAIDDVVREWGYIDDKAKHEGKLYSSKAPLASIIGALAYAPVHLVAGEVSRPALTRICRGALTLPCLALAFFMWRGLRRRADPTIADVVTVGVVVAVLPTLNVLSGHALAALAPAAALALIDHEHARSRRWPLVVTGAALAAAVGAEYPALVVAVPLGALAIYVHRLRGLAWLSAGAAPVVAVVCAAHTAMFGAPWRTGYSFLENRHYQQVVEGVFGIGAPDFGVIVTVLVSASVGLFFYAPFLLPGLAMATARLTRLTRAERIAVGVALVLLLLFIGGFRGWRGGWSVGPRYISEAIGLLALPAALTLDRVRYGKHIAVALVAVTLVHSGVPGMFFPHLPEVYANPVHEMMLPLVARGLAPDSLPLLLFPPSAAALLLLLLLAAPLALAAQRASVAGAGVAAVLVVVLVGPHVASTAPAARALENRRMLDNWRPESGNPFIDEAHERTDPRVLVAVDRARLAWPLVKECTFPVAEGAGAHGELAAGVPAGSVVVVGNEHAFELIDHVGAPVLVVTRADVKRYGKLPCPEVSR